MKVAGTFTDLSLNGTPGGLHTFVARNPATFISIKSSRIDIAKAVSTIAQPRASGTVAKAYATATIEEGG